MKPAALLIAAVGLAGPALADVTVNFRNYGHPNLSSRLVTFGPYFGALSGTPVVNGVPRGESYVAQLYLVEGGGTRIPIGNAANFRSVPQSDGLAGTWSGANRTIPGLPPDAAVNLMVLVWDASFGSYEAAASGGGAYGASSTFRYQNALSSPPQTTDTYMMNFPGIEMVFWLGFVPDVPEPHTYALLTLGLGGLWLLRARK